MNDHVFAMSQQHRPRSTPLDGLEASRRVGWARFYDELERCGQLEAVNNMLRQRIHTLVPELLDLVDAVLTKRNVDAFAAAYRIRTLVDEFLEREARRGA